MRRSTVTQIWQPVPAAPPRTGLRPIAIAVVGLLGLCFWVVVVAATELLLAWLAVRP
jgi:hypothetical protein